MKAIACCCALLTATELLGQPKPAADVPKPIENTLGMKFVKVPGAPVMFSIWETRVRDYRTFAEETRRDWARPDFEQTPDDPVVNVSWDDAAAFCQWLTARERKGSRLTDKQRYRLPTDAEWSVAVGLGPERGRTPEDRLQASVVWPWGCAWPPQPGDGNYAPELEADKFTNSSPVGSFKPNAQGVFDLGGNVWEWCDDWYNDARVTKALRGGSFHDRQPKDLLAAYRFSGTVHLSNDDIGFRVVLEDAQSETRTEKTGTAYSQVRSLDLSSRPWDNGSAATLAAADVSEAHPDHFMEPSATLAQALSDPFEGSYGDQRLFFEHASTRVLALKTMIPRGGFYQTTVNGAKVLLDVVCAAPCEISHEQFRQFDANHASRYYQKRSPPTEAGAPTWLGPDARGLTLNGDRQPVVRVPWDEARAFCRYCL